MVGLRNNISRRLLLGRRRTLENPRRAKKVRIEQAVKDTLATNPYRNWVIGERKVFQYDVTMRGCPKVETDKHYISQLALHLGMLFEVVHTRVSRESMSVGPTTQVIMERTK